MEQSSKCPNKIEMNKCEMKEVNPWKNQIVETKKLNN